MTKENTSKTGYVVWRFEDGSTEKMPLVELEEILQRQHHRMAESDDPLVAEAGKRRLRQAAEEAAAHQSANLQRAAIARRPRTSSTLKAKIMQAMASEKQAGTSFKTFIAKWEMDTLDGLRCRPDGAGYIVMDDDSLEECQQRYTWGTLQSYYSQS